MSAFVKKYPAISLLILAMIFGTAPLLGVTYGLLPPAAAQLGALSPSLAAIVLVVQGVFFLAFLSWRFHSTWVGVILHSVENVFIAFLIPGIILGLA